MGICINLFCLDSFSISIHKHNCAAILIICGLCHQVDCVTSCVKGIAPGMQTLIKNEVESDSYTWMEVHSSYDSPPTSFYWPLTLIIWVLSIIQYLCSSFLYEEMLKSQINVSLALLIFLWLVLENKTTKMSVMVAGLLNSFLIRAL